MASVVPFTHLPHQKLKETEESLAQSPTKSNIASTAFNSSDVLPQHTDTSSNSSSPSNSNKHVTLSLHNESNADAPVTISKTAKDLHLPRRITHFIGGIIVFSIYTQISEQTGLIILISGLIPFTIFIKMRKHSTLLSDLFVKLTGPFLRKHEKDETPAAVYFFWGNFFAILLFERFIAYLAILFVALGDPVASMTGITWKSVMIAKGKSLYGTLACGVACGVAALLTFLTVESGEWIRYQVSPFVFFVVSTLIGGLAEFLPSDRHYGLDDNLTIQLYTGILYKLFFMALDH
eukprot:TRINITY_DN10627_c0_g1_i3.p1 TRINITY_DN10627_c0_g1~~TRINITY_DN10627_c0_g1_i3.p1  ORF type:complete len:292 (+),score=33.20 TRINITY_DN10627_c0_g1_i3:82-957(+)